MKRILVVTEVFYPEHFLINDLVQEWDKRGVKVDVLTQWPSYPQGKVFEGYQNNSYGVEQWGNITIHRFKLIEGYKKSKIRKIWNYWTFVRKGTKIAQRIGANYDCVFVHQTGPLTLALPAVAIKQKFGIPLITWSFDIWPHTVYAYGFPRFGLLDTFLTWVIKRVYSNSDRVFVSSKHFAEVINQYVPGKQIDYVPNWLQPSVGKPSSISFDPECFHFTFTGNISISQNLERVVRGFIQAAMARTQLHIVGDGSTFEQVKSVVEELEATDRVILHGRKPYEEVSDILKQSDVLVLPLLADEGMERTEPFKIQSYLQSGKPIYGIIRGAGKEIIESERLGLCVDPMNTNAIAEGFVQMKDSAEKNGESVKQSSLQLMNERFNREKIIEKINTMVGLTPPITLGEELARRLEFEFIHTPTKEVVLMTE